MSCNIYITRNIYIYICIFGSVLLKDFQTPLSPQKLQKNVNIQDSLKSVLIGKKSTVIGEQRLAKRSYEATVRILKLRLGKVRFGSRPNA